jgi:hypothetical protein
VNTAIEKYFEIEKTADGKLINKKGEEVRPSCANCRSRGKYFCPISKCRGNNCGTGPNL